MKMKRSVLLLFASAIALTEVSLFTACSDDDDDGKVEETIVKIDELLKAGDPTVRISDSGVGNLLDDYRNLIKGLSGSNDDEDLMELDFYKQRLSEIEAYCQHKSDSVKEADPERYQQALDSLRAADPSNSLDAGLGQIFGTYGWAVLSYMDVGADGKKRRMSTLALFPRNVFCSLNAEHVILCPHWTIASDAERPTNYVEASSFSYKSDNSNVMAGEWAAFDEYLVIMPDYEGYGESKDVAHPYLIREVQSLAETYDLVFDESDSEESEIETITVAKNKKSQTFSDIIQYDDKERLLKRLHVLIDGRRGADVGCVILRALQENYITRLPTQKEYESEFKRIGSWTAIHNYMSDNNQNALDRANKIVFFS